MNEMFKNYLHNHSLEGISSISKSDLHNHFGKGGSKYYIEKIANVKIDSPPTKFDSLFHMDEWFKENIRQYCPYLRRLEAAFVQAASDNISVLAASFGFGNENTIGDIDFETFIDTMKGFN